ncbi:hypothetical protein P4493_05415 [Bacillus thuringiensis]|uniref:Uncharacterized protein n=3 Tax=Bacillus thuringiensis TaxID=1428 RepID=A0A0B5NC72_BACTU|nr:MULTISPECIES: hypothetical protein [Bacillus]MEC2534707.1 hypothetical protein [Bacillus cereus]MED1153565.1 hypothetical protein [Bacillus paranthracis]OUB09144.1 hypothetical protein BK708_31900 [Bacillus thuringiensis serovar yunnanensis]AFQ29893.1 hypothetical protein BTF1_28962 [Bacillus thuringiensis HD-789]AJG73990.1 hypothetical protein BF38_5680 [Bacillus thuringiensis]
MIDKQFEIPYMGNTVKLNVFHRTDESVESGMPVLSFGRLRTLLESGNQTYVALLNKVSELELELQKYKEKLN